MFSCVVGGFAFGGVEIGRVDCLCVDDASAELAVLSLKDYVEFCGVWHCGSLYPRVNWRRIYVEMNFGNLVQGAPDETFDGFKQKDF